jgi:hypothetical protein
MIADGGDQGGHGEAEQQEHRPKNDPAPRPRHEHEDYRRQTNDGNLTGRERRPTGTAASFEGEGGGHAA